MIRSNAWSSGIQYDVLKNMTEFINKIDISKEDVISINFYAIVTPERDFTHYGILIYKDGN